MRRNPDITAVTTDVSVITIGLEAHEVTSRRSSMVTCWGSGAETQAPIKKDMIRRRKSELIFSGHNFVIV